MFNILPNTLFIGRQILYLPTCHSTNDIAFNKLSDNEVLEGAIVVTSEQTAGKGQRGNKWESEAGKNLTFSLILKPDFLKVSDQFYLNIITSLAVYQVLTHFNLKKVKIKWPNDVYVNGLKISGILIQNVIKGNSITKSIVGVGLNVNQETFTEPRAVSMNMLTGREYELSTVLRIFCEKFEQNYLALRQNKLEPLKQKYLLQLLWLQEKHLFQAEDLFEGIIQGVDESGLLIVEVGNEIRKYSFKEVSFIR